jgi:hypothetical protein
MYEVTSSTIKTAYVCKQSGIYVHGTISVDNQTDKFLSIDGYCYRLTEQGEQGESFGNFNGHLRESGIKFNLSEMSVADSSLVLAAIDEIMKANHIADNSNEEEDE